MSHWHGQPRARTVEGSRVPLGPQQRVMHKKVAKLGRGPEGKRGRLRRWAPAQVVSQGQASQIHWEGLLLSPRGRGESSCTPRVYSFATGPGWLGGSSEAAGVHQHDERVHPREKGHGLRGTVAIGIFSFPQQNWDGGGGGRDELTPLAVYGKVAMPAGGRERSRRGNEKQDFDF